MHSALIIVKKPEGADWNRPKDATAAQRWSNHQQSEFAAVNNYPAAVEVLGEGCVLVKLEKGADALAHLLNAASSSGLEYRVLFFEKAPAWIRPK